MTFASRELSRTEGAPIALFLFTYGPGSADIYAYTSSEEPIIYNGNTYAPVPINNDSFTASGSLDKATVDLKLSKSLDINTLFSGYPPSQIVTLQLYAGHVGETELKPVWIGRVLSDRIEDNDLILTCEPISTSMRRSGLRGNYQRSCGLAFCGVDCTVSRSANTITPTVAVVETPSVTLPAGWNGAQPVTRYVGGLVWWTDVNGRMHYRSLMRSQSPTVVTLDGDCSSLLNGMTLNISASCNHTMDDCNYFHNILNYDGEPWIPLTNPLGIVNNYV